LPGRTSVVVTRNANYSVPGVILAGSLEAAISACGNDEEIFVIGGAELYRQAIALADRIYLTLIDADISGDAHFTELDNRLWRESGRECHEPDEKNRYFYHFVVYDRKPEVQSI
jgi:dihydrofolate reductase